MSDTRKPGQPGQQPGQGQQGQFDKQKGQQKQPYDKNKDTTGGSKY